MKIYLLVEYTGAGWDKDVHSIWVNKDKAVNHVNESGWIWVDEKNIDGFQIEDWETDDSCV